MTNRNYPVEVFEIATTEGNEWMARFPDVRGCVGGGETPEEALHEALENLEFHLESLEKLGLPIPEPSKVQTTFKGNISVRMSSGLHEQVSYLAKKEDISINQFIVEAISERVGKVKTENTISKLLNGLIEKLDSLLDSFISKTNKKNNEAIFYSSINGNNDNNYKYSNVTGKLC